MKVNKVDHICIAVKNLAEAHKVWEPVLGKEKPDDEYIDEPESSKSLGNKGRPMGKVLRDYEVYLVYVNSDRCDSGEECVLMCPTDVFEMPHKAIPVRPQNCVGCLTCAAVCKSKAIIITEI